MTVFGKELLSLIHCFVVKIYLFWKEILFMKHFLMGAAVVVGVWIVLIVINVICNINGHELDSVVIGVMAPIIALSIYNGLLKKEKNKNDQE